MVALAGFRTVTKIVEVGALLYVSHQSPNHEEPPLTQLPFMSRTGLHVVVTADATRAEAMMKRRNLKRLR